LKDIFVLLRHFDDGGDLFADAAGDHGAAEHGAAGGDMRLAAEWDNLVVAHVPDKRDVVVICHSLFLLVLGFYFIFDYEDDDEDD
jgi:hypothetical protein